MNRTSAEEDAFEDAPAPWGVVECAIPGGVLALVVTWELTCPPATLDNLVPRIVTCVAFLLLVAYLLNRVRRRGLKELSQVRAVARAVQEVLLRPLPARIDGLAFHARQLSASRGADVGGDLYEAVATPHGVRVVIGDVRGHGLPAIGAVAAVLGSFREAAHDEPGLDGVLRRLDRAHQRHLRELWWQETVRAEGLDGEGPVADASVLKGLGRDGPGPGGWRAVGRGFGVGVPGGWWSCGRWYGWGPGRRGFGRWALGRWRSGRGFAGIEYGAGDPEGLSAEEFVTVLLLEIGADAQVRALNCGHPWPYRLGRGAVPLATAEPLPPLGAFPLPTELPLQRCGPLLPGESLFLHTDGAQDARDSAGRFFGLESALAEAVAGARGAPLSPADVVRRVHAALLRHTGGRITDDMALLVLRNDRPAVRAGDPAPDAGADSRARDVGPPGDRPPESAVSIAGPPAGHPQEQHPPEQHPPESRAPEPGPPEPRSPGASSPDVLADTQPEKLADLHTPEQRPCPRSGMTVTGVVRTLSFRR